MEVMAQTVDRFNQGFLRSSNLDFKRLNQCNLLEVYKTMSLNCFGVEKLNGESQWLWFDRKSFSNFYFIFFPSLDP